MTDRRRRIVTAPPALLLCFVTACGPGTTQGQPGGSVTGPRTQSQAPKALTLALLQEPTVLSAELAQTNVNSGGVQWIFGIAHNYLVIEDDQRVFQPRLAVEKPSAEKGTWRIAPDGTMETTWKIRPNVKWHDGVPFTANDLLFSFGVFKDPAVPSTLGRTIASMESVTVADPLTVMVRWSAPYVRADEAPGLSPLARHLLEDAYRTDPTSLASSPKLGAEFVGLGPYRLTKWEAGSHMEFTRFDDYYLGRPPLDTVIVRFVGDPNTVVANVLSGAVDLVPPMALDLDAVVEVRRRWEGTGNQVRPELGGGYRVVEIQHRPEFARPKDGFTDRTVRQAFYRAVDRSALAEVLTGGSGAIADSWFRPADALRAELEASIPQFPYDPAAAQRQLSEARWARGPDGVLTHQAASGERERFDIQLTARGPRDAKEQSIIADNWKSLGAQVELGSIPPALQSDREYLSTLPGSWLATLQIEHLITDRLHTKSITSPATRWTGSNRGGYSNPKVDALLDQLAVAIVPAERLVLHKALLQEQMGDVPIMPLYWEADVLLAVKSVRLPSRAHRSNMIEFDKE